ncbi:MAG: heavy metal translocating P-type ATPase [Clostridia bacterium]
MQKHNHHHEQERVIESCNRGECGCHHCHHAEGEREENTKISKWLYGISILLFAISFLPIVTPYKMYIHLAVVLLAGYELILTGIKNMFHLNFEEDTLMTIAVIAAFILGEYPESCMVVLLFRLGEFLEEKAVENSNKNIKSIVEIKAKTANKLNEKEEVSVLAVEQIQIGDRILIKPGEMVPLDCRILKGNSTLDMANITGESVPVYVEEEMELLSGSLNLTGSLTAMVTKDYAHSTASQIVDLVYEATNNKGKTEAFITKFSRIYTPIVISIAVLLAIFPPLCLAQEWKEWIMRALVFLVASCPCSIVISVPLAFFSSVGSISKKGMLIKGTKHIEALAKAKYIAFDKTGTITTGKMVMDEFVNLGNRKEIELLSIMQALEKNSNHPISTAIGKEVDKYTEKIEIQIENYKEIPGHGIEAQIEEKQVLFGNQKLLEKHQVEIRNLKQNANYLVIDGKIEGYITLKEQIREDAKQLDEKFKKVDIKEVIMLTGDHEENAKEIAMQVGISQMYAGLLPQDKLEKVKALKEKGKVIFVGDGINDSPVLAVSDFGISMGEATEIANSTADAILISNRISSIPKMIQIARKTMHIIQFNIFFSLVVKAIILTLGMMGNAPVWLAIIADTGVSLITVLNSVRIMKKSKHDIA